MVTTDPARRVHAVHARRLRRELLTAVGFSALAAAAYCVMLGQGPVELSPLQVLDVLTGGGSTRAITVVWELRLPVAVATVVAGAALGAAGSWTQVMARNPLASPDILGVSGGAAVCVVWGTVLLRPEWAQQVPLFWWRAALGLLGAAIVVGLLFALAGFSSAQRVVLVGLALSLLANALVYYALARADMHRAADAQTWLAGSTAFVRMEALLPLCLGLAPFILIGLWAQRQIGLLAHDDATATTLGVDVRRTRACVLLAATGVVAVVVSLVGPIGFVALMAPQVARIVSGAPTPQLLSSAAAGAAVLAGCGVLAGFLPFAAPVGLISAIVGGPVLVWLVWRGVHKNGRVA
ncbi:FecCD family ABC transporter permease [Corynebacterium heidelbergense]|uniref:Iron ABC transporter permease n=1 Tax=Corynebacterium heidelbergense TaxID=2055947 RepID=A0A364V5P7_9CORY|nr:iron ABC transporter permease [Corynebacterium heidelbergense]RAV31957.1 iron ABC transporter permease [Corynebacterium heidelbergense]